MRGGGCVELSHWSPWVKRTTFEPRFCTSLSQRYEQKHREPTGSTPADLCRSSADSGLWSNGRNVHRPSGTNQHWRRCIYEPEQTNQASQNMFQKIKTEEMNSWSTTTVQEVASGRWVDEVSDLLSLHFLPVPLLSRSDKGKNSQKTIFRKHKNTILLQKYFRKTAIKMTKNHFRDATETKILQSATTIQTWNDSEKQQIGKNNFRKCCKLLEKLKSVDNNSTTRKKAGLLHSLKAVRPYSGPAISSH